MNHMTGSLGNRNFHRARSVVLSVITISMCNYNQLDTATIMLIDIINIYSSLMPQRGCTSHIGEEVIKAENLLGCKPRFYSDSRYIDV